MQRSTWAADSRGVCARRGRYSISVSMHGLQIPGSPFSTLVAAPEPNASRCEVRGDALTMGTARENLCFQVSFRDAAGALTHATDLDVFVEPVSLGSPRARASKNRKIRVKVIGERRLVVRAEAEVDSEEIGFLVPNTVVTLLEERVLPGDTVAACIALDNVSTSSKGSRQMGSPAGSPLGKASGFRTLRAGNSTDASPSSSSSAVQSSTTSNRSVATSSRTSSRSADLT